MTVKYNGVVETQIAQLVEKQFPAFYHDEGPAFVEFVKQYYTWLESETYKKKDYIAPGKSAVCLSYGNNEVRGIATSFKSTFANGDKIAVATSNSITETDYRIYNIQEVVNNSFLLLEPDEPLPDFACSKASYAQVQWKPNPTHINRRFLSNIDVDRTMDDFVIYFKEQFLKNIQIDTVTDTKTLVKNSLDLYRSKGTERGLQLLFRIAFGVNADVYYPINDVMRLSDGDYFVPTYLELIPSEITSELANKSVSGVISGATAFVDSVFRRTVNGKIIDVAFISSIDGNFQTGEQVITNDGEITTLNAPVITGSLNSVVLPATGQGTTFNLGDILSVKSTDGREARARVSELANATGVVDTTLIEGGYGYTANAEIAVSNLVLTIANVQSNVVAYTDAASHYVKNRGYFEEQEVVTQPKALINYTASTDTLTTGNIYSYHANGDVDGVGYIYSIEPVNTTVGEFNVSVISGNLETGNAIYTQANAESANITTYTDQTAVANVMGEHNNTVIYVTMNSGTPFTQDERLLGLHGNAQASSLGIFAGEGEILATNAEGIFYRTETIVGANSGATANIVSIKLAVGVKDVGNTFITDTNNFITFTNGGNGSVNAVSNGSGYSFSVSPNMLYTENVTVDVTQTLDGYTGLALDAASFGFPSNTTANATNFPMEVMLDSVEYTVGKVQALASVNPGVGYNILPIVKFSDEPFLNFRHREGYRMFFSNSTGTFANGEVVTQDATDARAIISKVTNTYVEIENLRFMPQNKFVLTGNSTTFLYGNNTGVTANIDFIDTLDRSDFLSYNAEFELSAITSNNAVKKIQLIDSGFGFIDGETVNAYSNSESISGSANVSTHGTAEGFHRDRGGFLSDGNHLHDGQYWQQFSYEIRSSLTLDKYIEMLRETVHMAGVSVFANQVFDSLSDFDMSVTNTTITTT